MEQSPLSYRLAEALAVFYWDSEPPAQQRLTEIIEAAGFGGDARDAAYAERTYNGARGFRVKGAFRRAEDGAEAGVGDPRRLLDGLLAGLRDEGVFDGNPETRRQVEAVRAALAERGWFLSTDGHLSSDAVVPIRAGGRPAINDAIARLRRADDEPTAQLTLARSLLGAVAFHVLRETGTAVPAQAKYLQVWRLARARLGLLPDSVPDRPGGEQVKSVLELSWASADRIEHLWRASGGPDQDLVLPAGVTRELVLLMVRQTCVFAEFVLAVLDRDLRPEPVEPAEPAEVPARATPAAQARPQADAAAEIIRNRQLYAEVQRRIAAEREQLARMRQERGMPA